MGCCLSAKGDDDLVQVLVALTLRTEGAIQAREVVRRSFQCLQSPQRQAPFQRQVESCLSGDDQLVVGCVSCGHTLGDLVDDCFVAETDDGGNHLVLGDHCTTVISVKKPPETFSNNHPEKLKCGGCDGDVGNVTLLKLDGIVTPCRCLKVCNNRIYRCCSPNSVKNHQDRGC